MSKFAANQVRSARRLAKRRGYVLHKYGDKFLLTDMATVWFTLSEADVTRMNFTYKEVVEYLRKQPLIKE